MEVVWTETGRFEGGQPEKTKKQVYTSLELTPHLWSYCMNTHTHTHTHRQTDREWPGQALRPAAACALHLLVYVLLELKPLTGILHRLVLQLSETKEEEKKKGKQNGTTHPPNTDPTKSNQKKVHAPVIVVTLLGCLTLTVQDDVCAVLTYIEGWFVNICAHGSRLQVYKTYGCR